MNPWSCASDKFVGPKFCQKYLMGSITGYVLKAMMTSSILMLGFVSTEPFFQHTKYRRGLAAACPNSLGSKQTLITSQEECGRWHLTTSSPYSGTFSMICTVNSSSLDIV